MGKMVASDWKSYFQNEPYIQGLQLNVQDVGEKIETENKIKLANDQAANTQKLAAVSSPGGSNTIIFVIFGIAAAGLIGFAIYKKMKK
jgi:LPXTG-motif cell wall-anchored protein